MIAPLLRRFVALGLATLPLPCLAQNALDRCAAPADEAGVVTALPHVADTLKPGGQLDVLVVGSATVFGPESSLSPSTPTSQSIAPGATPEATTPAPPAPPATVAANERSFPRQMAKALMDAVPGVSVRVTVRGGRGMTANDMLVLIRAGLAANPAQLVIWQTGTVEAVQNASPSDFAQTLADGAALVHESNADLVLVDPQFSRFLQTNANLEPYALALEEAAGLPGVLLFHRYELMRSWVNDGQIDLEHTPRGDRKKTMDLLHACLGAQLARMVLSAARE